MRVHLYRGKPVNKADYALYKGIYEPDVFNEGFVYGSLIVKGKKYYICIGVAGTKLNCLINNATVTLVEVIPKTVGEYTNLTDCHDKIIFENDIIQYLTFDGFDCQSVVKFGEYKQDGSSGEYKATNCLGFYAEVDNFTCPDWCDNQPEKFPEYLCQQSLAELSDKCEIIGNIYDNPELLEAKK